MANESRFASSQLNPVTENHGVGGSIPPLGTIQASRSRIKCKWSDQSICDPVAPDQNVCGQNCSVLSAFGGKADMAIALRNVRF